MPRGEIHPTAIKIDRLVDRIRDGDIKIPAFQRGFVWDQEQIIELLDSINRNYPVGSILLWSSPEHLKASRNVGGLKIPDREPEYPVNYVLDGQQRLSSIFAVLCPRDGLERADDGYCDEPSVFDIAFRFDDEMFIPLSESEAGRESINLAALFDIDSFYTAVESLSPERRRAAKGLQSRFNNYEIPVVTISRRQKDEVGVIFERINSTGTKLTALDLLVAWTWSEEFHLKDAIDDLRATLDVKGFGDVPPRIILQCLSAVLDEDTKTKTILALKPDRVRTEFGVAAEAIAAAIDFLSTEFKVQSLDLLPHLQQIVPLAYFFCKVTAPTQDQASALRKWFWKTSFSRRYSAQTDDKMNADIGFMKSLVGGDSSGIIGYSPDHSRELLMKLRFTRSHPYTRALLLLLAQKSPLDLTNGVRIDLGQALSSFNQKEYHHVFPRAFLKQRGVSTDKVNSLCNFCFLPSGSNKRILQRKPSDYIFTLVPAVDRKPILESNLLPLRMEIYQADDYESFPWPREQTWWP